MHVFQLRSVAFLTQLAVCHYSRLLLSVSHRIHSLGRQWHTHEHLLNVILPETRHFVIHSAARVKGTPLWTVLSRSIETLQKAQHAK